MLTSSIPKGIPTDIAAFVQQSALGTSRDLQTENKEGNRRDFDFSDDTGVSCSSRVCLLLCRYSAVKLDVFWGYGICESVLQRKYRNTVTQSNVLHNKRKYRTLGNKFEE